MAKISKDRRCVSLVFAQKLIMNAILITKLIMEASAHP